jgi:hypothetical protein
MIRWLKRICPAIPIVALQSGSSEGFPEADGSPFRKSGSFACDDRSLPERRLIMNSWDRATRSWSSDERDGLTANRVTSLWISKCKSFLCRKSFLC